MGQRLEPYPMGWCHHDIAVVGVGDLVSGLHEFGLEACDWLGRELGEGLHLVSDDMLRWKGSQTLSPRQLDAPYPLWLGMLGTVGHEVDIGGVSPKSSYAIYEVGSQSPGGHVGVHRDLPR